MSPRIRTMCQVSQKSTLTPLERAYNAALFSAQKQPQTVSDWFEQGQSLNIDQVLLDIAQAKLSYHIEINLCLSRHISANGLQKTSNSISAYIFSDLDLKWVFRMPAQARSCDTVWLRNNKAVYLIDGCHRVTRYWFETGSSVIMGKVVNYSNLNSNHFI
jgi:hypothetical protein